MESIPLYNDSQPIIDDIVDNSEMNIINSLLEENLKKYEKKQSRNDIFSRFKMIPIINNHNNTSKNNIKSKTLNISIHYPSSNKKTETNTTNYFSLTNTSSNLKPNTKTIISNKNKVNIRKNAKPPKVPIITTKLIKPTLNKEGLENQLKRFQEYEIKRKDKINKIIQNRSLIEQEQEIRRCNSMKKPNVNIKKLVDRLYYSRNNSQNKLLNTTLSTNPLLTKSRTTTNKDSKNVKFIPIKSSTKIIQSSTIKEGSVKIQNNTYNIKICFYKPVKEKQK